MRIETERLVLREFGPYDLELTHAYGSDMRNLQYVLWGPNTLEDSFRFLAKAIRHAREIPRLSYDFAVEEKDSGRFIGNCGISMDENHANGELEYVIDHAFWGKGYATEFTKALIQFGFTQLKLHRIFATCDTRNTASLRVMEKNHMRLEGTFLKCRQGHGGWFDQYVCAILADEWKDLKTGHAVLEVPDGSHGQAFSALLEAYRQAEELPIPVVLRECEGDYHLFLKKVEENRAHSWEKERLVPEDFYFLVDQRDGQLLGGTSIRRFPQDIPVDGRGHLTCGIRPDQRGKGYGGRMMRLALAECKNRGMERVQLTCRAANAPCVGTIESCGGVLSRELRPEGERLRQYWVNL